MDQVLLALEKVGITGEVWGFAAVLVAYFVALLGSAVLIAAATRNWSEQQWWSRSIPCIIALVFIAVVLSVGKPPAPYVGVLLVFVTAVSIAIATPIRREYFAPKPDREAKPQ